MTLAEHIKNIKNLHLPNGQFVVVSSGTLALHGIREAKDIDLIVKPGLWSKLSEKYSVRDEEGVLKMDFGNNIEALGTGSRYIESQSVSPEMIFAQAQMHEGIKFMNLVHLRKIKAESTREKDLADVILIDDYIRTTSK